MPLTVQIDAKGNDRLDLSTTLQVTILSGDLILCDTTLPLGMGLSESNFFIGRDIEITIGHEIK